MLADILDKLKAISEKQHEDSEKQKIRISFDYTDFENEKFFLHGLDPKYYNTLFQTLQNLHNSTAKEIRLQTSPNLTPKSIRWRAGYYITEESFPSSKNQKIKTVLANHVKDDAELQKLFEEYTKDSFEIRVGKKSGRIHGFLIGTIFYIVWFDPAHNLIPGKEKKTGKLKPIKLPNVFCTVKPFCAEVFNQQREDNQELHNKYRELEEKYDDLLKQIDEYTKPN